MSIREPIIGLENNRIFTKEEMMIIAKRLWHKRDCYFPSYGFKCKCGKEEILKAIDNYKNYKDEE